MLENIETNPLVDRLPPHLKQFIKPQNYELYTYQDQAVWRHVMRKNVEFLSQVAHGSYLAGLKKTGISIDYIPSMYGMNRILKEIGWAAVAVDGFIPPAAFMEFQAYKILVIAADIRKLDNIEYTPAPDIIHEAAGHAPIIASPDYAEYLRRFGEIGSKAISSAHDHEMYEAVRKISILKEVRSEKKDAKLDKEIAAAEAEIERLQNKKVTPSEMSLVRNLHWWTVEYGLVGTLESPKLYGAGLLSSIGESKSCLEPGVEKRPYSIDAAYQDFDITRKQPHLYVTPNFAHLSEVLEEFANTMAVRKGGHRGLQKLINSKSLGTIEISTGLQVSGIFTRMITNDDNHVVYFETSGPSALAYREKELIGHGTATHKQGFLSPLGKLKGINLAIEDMGPRDLQAYNFYDNERIEFTYESGIKVEGLNVTGQRNVNGKLMLIQFIDCTVSYKDEILFSPADGMLNLAVGKEITSAYAGPADYYSFDQVYHESDVKTIKSIFTKEQIAIQKLYEKVRHFREEDKINKPLLEKLKVRVENEYPNQWLLIEEIEELIS
ncbi:phenylalanine 4-monooxygenase [Nonlabens sp. MB-3u-79]|uniref:aromatic amino acid hydroxylase n=1 Tax=Nonlabens sp. MB-3u-79 TaxID=2058134 RepID=UPI000C303C7C|nr:aromatic amino acid hydroxylase [Nonlabens sp. MB-3u-79]AUC79139.1 phenylalanine 4-monooxygenase [Nonlabens sp. MB-3u-79]|tara:strand:- start:7244 stop:8896 length:1653 start_codon:yes stop_codon:yes gene_type:complete